MFSVCWTFTFVDLLPFLLIRDSSLSFVFSRTVELKSSAVVLCFLLTYMLVLLKQLSQINQVS